MQHMSSGPPRGSNVAEILIGQKTCHSQATRRQKLEIIAVNFQSAFSTLKCLVVRKSGASSSALRLN